MFTIYFPNLKLPNNFINNHSWNKFQRNFLQSYRILQIIITYYKISESSIFFITFYLGFIAARIAKSALKFRERMRECLQDTRLRNRGVRRRPTISQQSDKCVCDGTRRSHRFSFSFLFHPPPRLFPSKSIHPLLAMLPS